MKTTTKFRPQGNMRKAIMKNRRLTGRNEYDVSWQSRIEWYPAGFKPNHRLIFKQSSKLHYLACHAPEAITKRWKTVYNNFYKKHFGAHNNGSVRYLNTWSCHSWL